jgi:hypothetical protein
MEAQLTWADSWRKIYLVDGKEVFADLYWTNRPLESWNEVQYRQTSGVVFFFDLGDRDTFDKLSEHEEPLLATVRGIRNSTTVPAVSLGVGHQVSREVTRAGMVPCAKQQTYAEVLIRPRVRCSRSGDWLHVFPVYFRRR